MKLPIARIESAVSPDESRYMINAVKLDVEKKKMIATDGHILAVIPVETSEGDVSGLIPKDAFPAFRKLGGKNKKYRAEVVCNGKVSATDGVTALAYDYTPGNFLNWEAVVPKVDDTYTTVSLNLDLLVRLAAAIGAGRAEDGSKASHTMITLKVKDSISTVQVTTSQNVGAIGAIMPGQGINFR